MSHSQLKSLYRSFSFKPSRTLKFVDGKYKLLEANALKNYAILNQVGGLLGTAVFARRVYKYHKEMGWISFFLQSLMSLGSFGLAFSSYATCQMTTKHISLLEDGKRFEISTVGALGLGPTRVFYIQDIVNPEVHTLAKMVNKALDSYSIIILDNEVSYLYLLEPSSIIHDQEILTQILKSNEIEIEEEDVIDI